MSSRESRLVGKGVFMWDAKERRTNRYGYFYLDKETFSGEPCPEANIDVDLVDSLVGMRVKVTARVAESRKSGHLGDESLKVYPSQPDVGEEVVVGKGKLQSVFSAAGNLALGLVPRVPRDELWLDPRKLYRLHDQTVELLVEETEEEDEPVADLHCCDETAVSMGDGFVQVKTKREGPLKVLAKVEPMGDGAFLVTPPSGEKKGEMFRIGGER